MHASKSLWIAVLAAALVGTFAAGYTVGLSNSSSMPGIGAEGGYDAGFEAARQKIADARVFPPVPEKIFSLGGMIKSNNANTITLNAFPVDANPLNTSFPATRTVTITAQTIITRLVPLSAKEFETAMAAFKKQSASKPFTAPPDPFRSEKISASDLKADMNVTVTSETDIKRATAITATSITVNPTK